jgi:hypothetical protein
MWSFTNDSKDSASSPQILARYFRKINALGIKYAHQTKFKPKQLSQACIRRRVEDWMNLSIWKTCRTVKPKIGIFI